jgi:hypothetical protein
MNGMLDDRPVAEGASIGHSGRPGERIEGMDAQHGDGLNDGNLLSLLPVAAQAVYNPPAGFRSFCKVRSYLAASGEEEAAPLCLVMIETAEAIANLDTIAATPVGDGLFVGACRPWHIDGPWRGARSAV